MKHRYLKLMEQAAEYVADAKPQLSNPSEVADFMRPIVQDEEQETLYAIYVNARNEVLHFEAVTRGLADRTSVHAREVFRGAILSNAVRIFLVHNHPSGDPTPSRGDQVSTEAICEAGKIIGITVSDHIIIGKKSPSRMRDYCSLRELGYVK